MSKKWINNTKGLIFKLKKGSLVGVIGKVGMHNSNSICYQSTNLFKSWNIF